MHNKINEKRFVLRESETFQSGSTAYTGNWFTWHMVNELMKINHLNSFTEPTWSNAWIRPSSTSLETNIFGWTDLLFVPVLVSGYAAMAMWGLLYSGRRMRSKAVLIWKHLNYIIKLISLQLYSWSLWLQIRRIIPLNTGTLAQRKYRFIDYLYLNLRDTEPSDTLQHLIAYRS